MVWPRSFGLSNACGLLLRRGRCEGSRISRNLKIAWGSLGVSIVVLAMKAGAYWVTGSVALYSDALETVINVVASVGALVALWFAEQPADANHPYV